MPYHIDKNKNLTTNLQSIATAVGLNNTQSASLRKLHNIQLIVSRRNAVLKDALADDVFERCMSFTVNSRISFNNIVNHRLFANHVKPSKQTIESEHLYLKDYACIGATIGKYCDKEYYENLRLLSATCSMYCGLREFFSEISDSVFTYACFSISCKLFSLTIRDKKVLNTDEVITTENEILQSCTLHCILPTASSILEAKNLRESKQLLVAKKVIRLLLTGTPGTINDLVDNASL